MQEQLGRETLNYEGEFSYPWYASVYCAGRERTSLQGIVINHGLPAGLRHESNQLASFLTERGNFDAPLTANPLTKYEIEILDGGYKVYVWGLNQLGEWSRNFFDYDVIDGAIGAGLKNMFDGLVNCSEGEGVGLISPTELYSEQGSKGNVLNLLRVVERTGSRIQVAGFWLFFDKEVSIEDRLFLRHILNPKSDQALDTTFDNPMDQLVASPQRLPFSDSYTDLMASLRDKHSGKDALDQELLLIEQVTQAIDNSWSAVKGRALFDLDVNYERTFRIRVNELVKLYALPFLNLLLDDSIEPIQIYESLNWLVMETQKEYALYKHISWHEHLALLYSAQFHYRAAFHPSNGENLNQYGIPELGIWFAEGCGSKDICQQCGGNNIDNNGYCTDCLRHGK